MTAAAEPRPASRPLRVHDLGRRPYTPVLELQRRLALERRRGALREDVLLLVEHDPVITLGRGADPAHVREVGPGRRPIEIVEVERGGDVTYHGPGQLVGYPILDLSGYRRDLHWYLRRLEEVLIRAIGEAGVAGFRVEGYTGVWTGDPVGRTEASGTAEALGTKRISGGMDALGEKREEPRAARTPAGANAAPLVASGAIRKIASIGVHASRWVTWHGFALNVTGEPLAAFPAIVPCGIEGVHMTSLHREGGPVSMREARELVLRGFHAAFGCRIDEREGDPV